MICFFYKKFLWKAKIIREVIREERMEKMKVQKEVKVELFIVE